MNVLQSVFARLVIDGPMLATGLPGIDIYCTIPIVLITLHSAATPPERVLLDVALRKPFTLDLPRKTESPDMV
jgi:hypothetical protein